MQKFISIILVLNSLSICIAQEPIFWQVDNLSIIGGNNVEIIGNPKVIETDIGSAVEFNGIDDGLIVANNPMAGVTAFTVEIIFKPYTSGGTEQRFLHFQQDDSNRILIELRNNNDDNWTLDTFIKSGSSSKALLDYSFTHNLDTWNHAALTYKDGVMAHYVNGQKELEGNVDYQIINSGQTSLGVRLNKVSWFKGAIHSVKVTPSVLSPTEFMEISSLGVKENDKNQLITKVSPNPISSSSLVTYQLDEPGKVSIKIINILGKEVATIFNDFKNIGSHKLDINSNNLNSGMYFLVINSGNKTSVQKIIISK
ncbi:LamG-like jellyroll fold domain-containing protein [Thalassobellus sediminis]|uniref:LamG-like jellyroll fold domain-containing protein n=1 Tax=Thalassobellus sediminis TaxID=3367753 RepID=UPI0037891798